jgi:hypothetical protein
MLCRFAVFTGRRRLILKVPVVDDERIPSLIPFALPGFDEAVCRPVSS